MWYQTYFSYGLFYFLSFHYFYFYSSRGKLFEVVLDEEAESGTFVDDGNLEVSRNPVKNTWTFGIYTFSSSRLYWFQLGLKSSA